MDIITYFFQKIKHLFRFFEIFLGYLIGITQIERESLAQTAKNYNLSQYQQSKVLIKTNYDRKTKV